LLEGDAILLRNRVRHLQMELEKTKMRSSETENRSSEIRRMKKKMEERRTHKRISLSSETERQEKRARELRRVQEDAKTKLLQAKLKVEEEAKMESDKLRKEKCRAREKLFKIKFREEAITREKVRIRKLEVEKKKEKEETSRKQEERRKIESVILTVATERMNNRMLDSKIEMLERKEGKWIAKLKDILVEQQSTFQELELELAKNITS